MARRKHDRTEFHLRNDHFCDGQFPFRKKPGRLAIRRPQQIAKSNAWSVLANKASLLPDFPVVYFPDANIAINRAAGEFWTQMRLHFFKHGSTRVVFSAPIISELKEWIIAPRRKHDLAESIHRALTANNPAWACNFGIKDDHPCRDAVYAYVHLLGFRRMLLDFLIESGSIQRSVKEAMNIISREFGERTQLIAKKGSLRSQNAPYVLNDEMHVILAIHYALETGKEVVVVTTDEDVLECFFKAQYMIDMHYRAMLSADLIAENNWFSQRQWCQSPKELGFVGEFELFAQPSPHFEEVLPACFTPVNVTCVYIKPDESMVAFTVTMETEMRRLLEIRSKTNGLSTDRLGGRSVHLDLSPIERGGFVGVVFENQAVFNSKTHLRFSYIDFAHVVNSNERYGAQTLY